MSLRRTIPVLAAAAILAAGCSGGSDTAAPGGDLAGTTIDIAGVWADDEQAAFEKVLDAFANKTGATVRYTSAGDELPTVLSTRIAGGSPPDLAVVSQPGLVSTLAKAGSLKPLSQAAATTIDAQYAPVWKQLGTVDGKLYGLVFKAANKSTVWYNAKTLDAGFTAPATWADFVGELRTLSDTGNAPLSVAGADGWTLTDWFENVYLQTAGADKYDQLTKHQIPWTDPSVKDAFAKLSEVLRPEYISGGPSSALQTEFTDSVTNVFGDQPKASIVYEGDFVRSTIAENTSAVVGETAKFFPFPTVGTPGLVTGGDTVVAMTDKPGVAQLEDYLASADAASIWAAEGGFLSPNKQVDPTIYPDDISRELARQITESPNVRFDMSDMMPSSLGGTKGDGFWKATQDYLADPSALDRILAGLETKATTAYAGT